MSDGTNRRGFLQTTAAAGAGILAVGASSTQAAGVLRRRAVVVSPADCATPAPAVVSSKSPNEKIAMASIGLGGKGSSDSADAGKFGDMVAICDVDDGTLNKAGAARFPKAKRFTDFRKMLDEMGKSIDAVTVSTPDHCHAPASLMAMRMGKHCFCQKPLAHTIYEARLMAKVAKESKVATQMGNQFNAAPSLRRAVSVIKAGALGTVNEVHVWTNRPIWPQGLDRPKSELCAGLDAERWNLWLGPAPIRPSAKNKSYHPFAWRGWWDFGCGALGDMACHTANMPYTALQLFNPTTVQAETSGHNGDSYPEWSTIVFDFPANNDRPAVKLYWYDGGKKPDMELFKGKVAKLNKSGCLVIGDKDTLYAPGDYCGNQVTSLNGAEFPEVTWKKSPGHFEEWVNAIRGGEPAMSNFVDQAGGLAETILLGNLAVWTAAEGKGPRVEWDAQNLKSPNIVGLETIIKPIYRPGYTLDV